MMGGKGELSYPTYDEGRDATQALCCALPSCSFSSNRHRIIGVVIFPFFGLVASVAGCKRLEGLKKI